MLVTVIRGHAPVCMYWHNLLCAPKSLDKWCSSIRALCMLSVRGTRYVQDSRNPRKIIKKGAYLRCWNLLCLPYPSTSVCTGGRARTFSRSQISKFYCIGGSAITGSLIRFIFYTKTLLLEFSILRESFLVVPFFLHCLDLVAVCNCSACSFLYRLSEWPVALGCFEIKSQFSLEVTCKLQLLKVIFYIGAKPRNLTQLNQPPGSYLCGTCMYLTEHAHYTDHTHSTLQVKPDL